MREITSAAVVGLGLIGGSLARELAARGVRVLGYDRDPAAVRGALAEGGIHAALGVGWEGIEEVEVLILAVPVDAAPAVLASAVPHLPRARLITDVGSTKRSIVAAAQGLRVGERFIGAHPLAGDHRSGWSASRAGLFHGARVFLCPTADTAPPALELARKLWLTLGARPETIEAEEHDRRLAWSSHLPQAASTALALALATAGVAPGELGSGGQDATRLAGSSPGMWTGIALENREALVEALDALGARLDELRAALDRSDERAVRRFFAAGLHWARSSNGGVTESRDLQSAAPAHR